MASKDPRDSYGGRRAAARLDQPRLTAEAVDHEWHRAREFAQRWYMTHGEATRFPIRMTAVMGFGRETAHAAPALRRMTMVGVVVQDADGTELQARVPTDPTLADQARLRYERELQSLAKPLLINTWLTLLAETTSDDPFADQ